LPIFIGRGAPFRDFMRYWAQRVRDARQMFALFTFAQRTADLGYGAGMSGPKRDCII
jgi:hypothetical protein